MSLTDPLVAPALPSQVWVNPQRRDPPGPRYDAAFLDRTRATIGRLGRTQVGAAVLRALKREFTVISPMKNHEPDGFGGPPGAAAATWPWDGVDATAALEPRRTRSGKVVPGLGGGSGVGTPSIIYYDVERCSAHAVREDGVMIHEMAHAMRNVWGVVRGRPGVTLPMGSTTGHPNSEEFFAQIVMNMYLVEVGRPPIVGYIKWAEGIARGRSASRSDRDGRSDRLRDAVEHKVRLTEQQYLRGIVARGSGMRAVFNELGSLPVPYNPFRDIDSPNAVTYLPARY